MKAQVLSELFEVTEMRDGCVFRTRSLGLHWVDQINGITPGEVEGFIVAPLGAKHDYRWERRHVDERFPNLIPIGA